MGEFIERHNFILSMVIFSLSMSLFSMGVLGVLENDIFLIISLNSLILANILAFKEEIRWRRILLFTMSGFSLLLMLMVIVIVVVVLRGLVV